MDFSFSDEQLAFRDSVRDLLAGECPPPVVRSAWADGGPPWPAPLWRKLADMGVVGTDLGPLDWVLVLEETGRAALPGPVVEHVAALPVLAAAGDDRLAALCGGELVATAGFRGWPFVPWAADADVVVLVDPDRDEARAVERPPGQALAAVDHSRRLYRIDWPSVWPAATPLPVPAGAVFDRAVLGQSAQLLGVAGHLVDVTVAYATARHQFGAPIGSFQAVKHHLANAWLRLDYARPAVYRAAWSLASADPDAAAHVSMAKALAADAAGLAARVALQVHGAIGYAWEHDLHLWLKRAWALSASWGDAAWHRRRVADWLGL
jgi:alkylation response protein AidB-like acyl-CoA dehydrogenase